MTETHSYTNDCKLRSKNKIQCYYIVIFSQHWNIFEQIFSQPSWC